MIICQTKERTLEYSDSAGIIKKEKKKLEMLINYVLRKQDFWPSSLKASKRGSVTATVVYEVWNDKLYTNTLLEIYQWTLKIWEAALWNSQVGPPFSSH